MIKKAIVVSAFCDKDDFEMKYSVDQEVEFDEERIMDLVRRGLVKLIDKRIGDNDDEIDINASVKEIAPLIDMCVDIEKLHTLLKEEKSKEKPRESLTKIIEKRIEELEA